MITKPHLSSCQNDEPLQNRTFIPTLRETWCLSMLVLHAHFVSCRDTRKTLLLIRFLSGSLVLSSWCAVNLAGAVLRARHVKLLWSPQCFLFCVTSRPPLQPSNYCVAQIRRSGYFHKHFVKDIQFSEMMLQRIKMKKIKYISEHF